ncbi:MAG: hypothetical protein Q7R79_02835 [bacterium]|nr:hypothetical protein [bacterium]
MFKDVDFDLIIPQHQRERLQGTCFRNRAPLAGNFLYWEDPKQVLSELQRRLVSKLHEYFETKDENQIFRKPWGITLDLGEPIGWGSTVSCTELSEDVELVGFKPNEYTHAWRVKDPDMKAVLTDQVTFIITFKQPQSHEDDSRITVSIESIYPGQYVPLGFEWGPREIAPKEAVFFSKNASGELLSEVSVSMQPVR